MATKISRRDLLKLAGGSALGLLFTPAPWKVLDDVSIWTQNGPWTTKLPHGESTIKFSACALCPAGCAVQARCVADHPVSLAGVAGHPLSHGMLCPLGLTGHHLAYHPLRLTQPVQLRHAGRKVHAVPTSLPAIISSLAEAITTMHTNGSAESVAVMDARPGRTLSLLYRQLLAELPHAHYLPLPNDEGAMLQALAGMCDPAAGALGIDWEHAHRVISFGAPLLEGWGTPGRILPRLRADHQTAGPLRIIQIETRPSRTALLAERWLALRPGTETALALGLAHVLLHEGLVDIARLQREMPDLKRRSGASFRDLIEQCTPERTAEITGVAPAQLHQLAQEAANDGPTVVLGSGDPAGGPLGSAAEQAIAVLNVLLGSVGRAGGILARPGLPLPEGMSQNALQPPSRWENVPDGSIRVLIMDATVSEWTLPWSLVARKLVPGRALVVSLSPYLAGPAGRADYVIPAPAHFQSYEEILPACDAVAASYMLSVPLLPAMVGAVEPLQVMAQLALACEMQLSEAFNATDMRGLLQQQVAALTRSGRGSLHHAGEAGAEATLPAAPELWEVLAAGGCWIDAAPPGSAPSRFRLPAVTSPEWARRQAEAVQQKIRGESSETQYDVVLMPHGWRGATGNALVSPVMSKLFQETGLQSLANEAALNPATAGTHALRENDLVVIRTAQGKARVRVHLDPAVHPGVLHVAVGPRPNGEKEANAGEENSILEICRLDSDSCWRVTPAEVVKG